MRNKMTPQAKRALEYVYNTKGHATISSFADDHAPIAAMLWGELISAGLIEVDAHKVLITDKGLEVMYEK